MQFRIRCCLLEMMKTSPGYMLSPWAFSILFPLFINQHQLVVFQRKVLAIEFFVGLWWRTTHDYVWSSLIVQFMFMFVSLLVKFNLLFFCSKAVVSAGLGLNLQEKWQICILNARVPRQLLLCLKTLLEELCKKKICIEDKFIWIVILAVSPVSCL